MTEPMGLPTTPVSYRLTSVFTVRGLHREGEGEVRFIDKPPVSAVLVKSADAYLKHSDRSNAVANLMLRGLFSDEMPSGTVDERITAFVEEARTERRKKHGEGPFLVVTAEGDQVVPEPKAHREEDEFIVWIDGGDRSSVIQAHDPAITAVVNSLILFDDAIAGIGKVAESVVYFRSDGKPIYARTLSMGGATAYVSHALPETAPAEIRSLFDSVSGAEDLSSVLGLLRRSFELESQDRFQAFLAAWLALEIFVGKTFAAYEQRMLADNRGDTGSKAAGRYWNRIKEVMKDKYRFADRFAAIAFQLDPEQADEDLVTASRIKGLRDGIVHYGDRVAPRELPLETTRKLTRKYVLLHVAARRTR